MKRDTRTVTAFAVCFVLLGSGCATTHHRQYAGASRPRAEVATIALHNNGVFTRQLNGSKPKTDKRRLLKETLLWWCGGLGVVHYAKNVEPQSAEVIPGDQRLEVEFYLVTSVTRSGDTITTRYVISKYPKTLSFEARGGCAYRVNGRQEGKGWSAYVEDVTDKESCVVCSTPDLSSSSEDPLQEATADKDVSTNVTTLTNPDGSKTITDPSK